MAKTTLPPGLIDTDILIDAMRGLPDAPLFLAAQRAVSPRKRVRISSITAMELIIGGRDPREVAVIRRFLDELRILTIDDRVSRLAMSFVEQFSATHGMEIPESLIAATAVRYGWPLYTRNLRHNRMIPGLMPIDPY